MPITNGYDSQEVMDALLGRIKWRSLNAGSAFPNNSQYEVARDNKFLTVGVSAGLAAGGNTYTDSSLIGWTFEVLDSAGVVFVCTLNANGFTLDTGTFITGVQYELSFKPKTVNSKSQISGRYFEQFHPMCTLNNLGAVIEQQLTASGIPLNSFLQDLEQGMIMTLLNGVFSEPQMLQDTLIFDRKLRQDNAWSNTGKFCGYRLYIAPGEFAARIVKASFIFNGVANFNLYLYQDMQKTPLYTIPVMTKANEEVLVDLPDWILHYDQQSFSQGGVFYIGYYQSDLGSVQALDQFVSQWNQGFAFGYTAFEATQTGTYDFNRIAIPYTFVTYGMNLRVEAYKDFTARIIKNASMFDEAMGLAMAVIVLGYEAMNTRTNVEQRQVQDLAKVIYSEINNSGDGKGDNPFIAGLKVQLRREMKKINDNFFKKPGVMTNRPPIWDNQSLQGMFP